MGTLLARPLRPLFHFAAILLLIFVAAEGVSRLASSATWQGWFAGPRGGFTTTMLGIQLGRLIVSLILIGALLALGYRRTDFFLARGRLNAPIKPVPWMGFPKAKPWTRFGGQYPLYIGTGLLAFLILGGRPSWPSFVQAAPMLPGVLLLAAMNAFSEEMTYRASLLAMREPVVGGRTALWSQPSSSNWSTVSASPTASSAGPGQPKPVSSTFRALRPFHVRRLDRVQQPSLRPASWPQETRIARPLSQLQDLQQHIAYPRLSNSVPMSIPVPQPALAALMPAYPALLTHLHLLQRAGYHLNHRCQGVRVQLRERTPQILGRCHSSVGHRLPPL